MGLPDSNAWPPEDGRERSGRRRIPMLRMRPVPAFRFGVRLPSGDGIRRRRKSIVVAGSTPRVEVVEIGIDLVVDCAGVSFLWDGAGSRRGFDDPPGDECPLHARMRPRAPGGRERESETGAGTLRSDEIRIRGRFPIPSLAPAPQESVCPVVAVPPPW